MAAEIKNKCALDLPIKDFSVPTQEEMQRLIFRYINLLPYKINWYVGCIGGIGRTGLFLTCLVKVVNEIDGVCFGDPIKYIRLVYHFCAVETKEQEDFVKNFNPTYLAKFLKKRVESRNAFIRKI